MKTQRQYLMRASAAPQVARLAMAAVLAAYSVSAAAAAQDASQPLDSLVADARQRVVKLYGAAVGLEKAYGSGTLISPDGQIVTALTGLLEGSSLRAVLHDGRVFSARVLKRDAVRQLAVLKIEADDLPHYAVPAAAADRPLPGDWLLAAANPFKVADGPEPVSVSFGACSGETRLTGRHRTRELPYEGPVLLTDIIISTPGSAGGALVDLHGRLVGVIGRAAISRQTNTYLNYALPADEVAAFLHEEEPPARPQSLVPTEAGAQRLLALGVRLFDVGGRIRPAYVERVMPESLAWSAGLRTSDLILAVGDQPVEVCDDVAESMAELQPGDAVELLVKRGDDVQMIELRLPEALP